VKLTLRDPSLVLLVGPSGSGKSTFAARWFEPHEIVSSDHYRGVVCGDPTDQEATADAFELVHRVVAARLDRNLLTVVDATNLEARGREPLLKLAKDRNVGATAIVFDVPEDVCVERNRRRGPAGFPPSVVRHHLRQMADALGRMKRERIRKIHVLRGEQDVDGFRVARRRPSSWRHDLAGSFDIIGDVHGCGVELAALLRELGWQVEADPDGAPVDAAHPDGRTLVFVGDLVDRGPEIAPSLRFAMELCGDGRALCVQGNHEKKLLRKLRKPGRSVGPGVQSSLDQLAAEDPKWVRAAADWIDDLPSHLVLDGGGLVVAHAGLVERYHGRSGGRVRAFALYGDTTGEQDEWGYPVRRDWAARYRGDAAVVYGHTPLEQTRWRNNTVCIDTACVFGGRLTAVRWPERDLVSVPARQGFWERKAPLESH